MLTAYFLFEYLYKHFTILQFQDMKYIL